MVKFTPFVFKQKAVNDKETQFKEKEASLLKAIVVRENKVDHQKNVNVIKEKMLIKRVVSILFMVYLSEYYTVGSSRSPFALQKKLQSSFLKEL